MGIISFQMDYNLLVVGGWTTRLKKNMLGKIGANFPNFRDEHKNIWVATTR